MGRASWNLFSLESGHLSALALQVVMEADLLDLKASLVFHFSPRRTPTRLCLSSSPTSSSPRNVADCSLAGSVYPATDMNYSAEWPNTLTGRPMASQDLANRMAGACS